MSAEDGYDVVLSRGARHALEERLPGAVAAAAFELVAGPLREEPCRVGTPLRELRAPLWSAPQGEYRVLYRVVDARSTVEVVRSSTAAMSTGAERTRTVDLTAVSMSR